MKGRIFDIKKFAVHDGPGIRTTLFLKGCPLSCLWCHNPEGISSCLDLWFFNNKCIACGSCISVCPENALSADNVNGRKIVIDYERCTRCGACVEACPTKALAFDGREIESGDAVKELLQDRLFFERSEGGITLSGGDPLVQHEFSREVLSGCRESGVHTAIETSMHASEKILDSFIGLVDLFIVDLKLMDGRRHREYTGVGNELLLSNFKLLAERKQNILVRIPLIPGITAVEDNIRAVGDFVVNLSPETGVELINFNPLAENKYRLMGRTHSSLNEMKPFNEEQLDQFYRILSSTGVKIIRETK